MSVFEWWVVRDQQTIIHSRGARSLPSMLGGGDLDGDIYNLILDVRICVSFVIGRR